MSQNRTPYPPSGPGTPGFLDELRDAMFACEPDLSREEWIAIGIAAKEYGLTEKDFDQWSSRGGKYPGPKEIATQWRAFGKGDRDSVSYKTIFHFAYQNGWKPSRSTTHPRAGHRQGGAHSGSLRNERRTGPGEPPDQRPDPGKAEKVRIKRERVVAMLAAARPADKYHPYLVRKKVTPEGLLQIERSKIKSLLGYDPKAHDESPLAGDHILLCPLHDGRGPAHLLTVEMIDERGVKIAVAGLPRAKSMWSLDSIDPSAPRHFVVEGFATAKSIIDATGERQVFAAGAKNNLANVVDAVRHHSPGGQIIVISDFGEASEQTAQAAAERVGGHIIVPPEQSLPQDGSDFNDMAAAVGIAEVRKWIDAHSVHPERITFAGAREWRKIDYVLPGLERGTVGLIVGPGSVGKTFFALEICASVSLGLSLPRLDQVFFEKPRGKTCLLLGEDSVDQISNRLHSMRKQFALSEQQLARLDEDMLVISKVGHDMTLVDSDNRTVSETAFVDYLRHLCWGRRLLIVDPLIRLHNGDENDNTAASRLMLVLTRTARETGCAILALHHIGKGDRDDWAAARGASAFNTSARWQLNIRGMNKTEAEEMKVEPNLVRSFVKCTGAKMNYGPGVDHFWLRRADGGVLVHTDPEARSDIANANIAPPGRATKFTPKPAPQFRHRGNLGSPFPNDDE